MELDVRDGKPTTVDAIRFSDTLVIKATNGGYQITNNGGVVQVAIPKQILADFIAALNAAQKLLG